MIGANTTLSGTGTLTLNSDLTAKSALAFNSFGGTIEVGQTLTIASAIDTDDNEVALTGGKFTSNVNEARIYLNSSAQIGENEGLAGSDFSGFKGQLSLAQKTYDVYDIDKLNSSAKLELNLSTINFRGIKGEFAN